jgi:two-component system phosphate regulon sensor histidine kinase PhoR
MQLQVDRAGLKLNVKDEIKELPEVLADKARMQQVVMNLLHNAIKYTPPGGTINIWAEIEGSMMKFEIRDTGVGINPENLERIFERFYKADRARSGGGTGLGLSIARHLVEAHGGRIWADSTLSEGSIFYFTLPLYKINKAKNQ